MDVISPDFLFPEQGCCINSFNRSRVQGSEVRDQRSEVRDQTSDLYSFKNREPLNREPLNCYKSYLITPQLH